VRRYAEEGFADFEELVRHLMRHHHELTNIAELSFQHPPEGFTFRFRNVLRLALARFVLGEGDLVMCSRGAHAVMQALVVRSSAKVVAVRDGLGGSTSFTTTLCTEDFRRELKGLLAETSDGRPLRRVFVPAPVWWVDRKTRCLGGETVDDLRKDFPALEIVLITIPEEVIDARLSLRECYDWYNADLASTEALVANAAEALAGRLQPFERATDAGFVRRLVLADDSPFAAYGPPVSPFELEPIAPESLGDIDDLTQVLVAYDEVIVERSDEAFPEDAGKAIRRVRATVGGREVVVRRTLVRKYPLADRVVRALFIALFVEQRSLEEVVSALDATDHEQRALANSMHAALASLELRRVN
jgi:hypothetical protein